MTRVRLFDFIEFDGQPWHVVAQDGTDLALRNLGTNRIRRVPVLDLLRDDSFLPDEGSRESRLDDLSVLDTVPTPVADRALFVHRHVYEVLHGYPHRRTRASDTPNVERKAETRADGVASSIFPGQKLVKQVCASREIRSRRKKNVRAWP